MEVAILFVLAGTLLASMITGDSDGVVDTEESDTSLHPGPDDPIVPESDMLTYIGQDSLFGTDGNDTITQREQAAPAFASGEYYTGVIDGGDGDDLIDLYNEANNGEFDYHGGSTVNGGDGNDTIEVGGYGSDIYGGDGNDELWTVSEGSSAVYGGEGNDVLTGASGHVGTTLLDGGPGNDTISGFAGLASQAFGGEGDDLIYVTGRDFEAGGMFQANDGGPGNDTIAYATTSQDSMFDRAPVLNGGADADLFELTIDEGTELLNQSIDDSPFEGVTELPDGTLRFNSVTLGDFNPDEDTIEVDATPRDDGYDLTTAQFELTSETTHLVLHYEHATEPARDAVIDLGNVLPSWDYVSFIGASQPDAQLLTS